MRKPLTKGQLMTVLAEKSGMSKKDVTAFLEVFEQVVLTETKEAGQCVVPGLGKLVKQQRNARVGRNPQTGAEIQIPAKTVCKFRVSKNVKDTVVS